MTDRPVNPSAPYGGGRLLVRPFLSPEENLHGFVQRAADANGFEASLLWRHVVRGLRAPGADVSFLVGLTGCTQAQAVSLLVPRRPPNSWALLPGKDVSNTDVTAHPGICVTCVGSKGVARACWCLRLCVGCDEHRIRLLDRCGDCGSRLERFRPSISRCACGADLLAQGTPPIADDEAAMLALVRRACGASHSAASDPKGPDELSLDDLLGLVVLVGAREAAPRHTRLLDGDGGDERVAGIVSHAARFFWDWPDNAIRSLRAILLEDIGSAGSALDYAGRRMVRVLNHPSDRMLSGPARGMLLGLALTAIEGRGVARLNPTSAHFGKGPVVGYMSTAEAVRLTGLTFNRTRRELDRSDVTELPGSRPAHQGVMYGRTEGETFAARVRGDAAARARLVSMRKLTAMLGVAPASVSSIVAAGLVGSESFRGREMFRIGDARKLLSDLGRAASGRDADPEDVRPRVALARFRRLSMGDLLRGALSGGIRLAEVPAASGPRRGTRPWIGVNNFVLCLGDLRATSEEAAVCVTVTEAAALLAIDRNRVRLLMELRFLECVDHAAAGWTGNVAVSKSSVDRFKARFTTSWNLGRLFPGLRVELALDAIGALPVVRGSPKFAVYEKSVVEELRMFQEAGRAEPPGIVGTSYPTVPVGPKAR